MEKGDLCLVSGVSGYLGSWIAKELLDQGYRVRGTVRDLNDTQRTTALRQLLPGVELVAADLRSDAGWSDAVRGVAWIFHVASPQAVKSERKRVEGAVSGTQHVLEAAFRETSVRKIVVTSSEAAVAYGHPRSKRLIDERDWTSLAGIGPKADYFRSKVLAEQLAWDMARNARTNPRGIALSTINPGLILGPSLVPWARFSMQLLSDIAQGKMPLMLDMKLHVVDVRDCARAHIATMQTEDANGRRQLLFATTARFAVLARIIAEQYGDKGFRPTARVAPHWLAKLLSLLSNDVRSIWSHVGNELSYQPQHTGMHRHHHRELAEIVHASMESMLAHGWLRTRGSAAVINPVH